MKKVLINAATVTDATKVEFILNKDDFTGKPVVRTRGLGTGDVVTIFEDVNGGWETGTTLTPTTKSTVIESLGHYAVDVVMTTAPMAFTADVVDGALDTLVTVNAGANYVDGTGFTFIPTGGNSDSLVTYNVVSGAVASPILTTPGTGWNDEVGFVLLNGPTAPGAEGAITATFTADIVNGTLTNLILTEAGSNYDNDTALTFTPTGGTGEITYNVVATAVDSPSITTAGTGYNDATAQALGGSPAAPADEPAVDMAFTADVVNGALTNLIMTNAGSNYVNATGDTFTPTGGTGEITYDVVLTVVDTPSITTPGTGYNNETGYVIVGIPTPPADEGAVDAIFSADIVSGVIGNLVVLNAGSNYVNATGVTFVPTGGNSDALVTYDVVAHSVTNAVLTTPGTGYTDESDVVLLGNAAAPADEGAVTATMTADIVNGALTNLTVTNAGSNYEIGAALTFVPTGGNSDALITYDVISTAFANAVITTPGTGFNDQVGLVLAGMPTAPAAEGSTTAVFNANVTNGILGSLTMTEVGSNYEAATGATFVPTGGNGDGLVTYDIIAGAVANQILTTPGTGYNNEVGASLVGGPVPPADETAVNATFTADVVNGTLTNLTVTNVGSNYDNDTGLTFTPTGGTGLITYDVVATSVTNAVITTPGTGYNDESDVVLAGFPDTAGGPVHVEVETSGVL